MLYLFYFFIYIYIYSVFLALVSAFSIESTCDNGKKWQLCKDVCKKATCTKNPDAKCVSPMGGCGTDACQPKFYDSLGKQVQCEYEALFCTL